MKARNILAGSILCGLVAMAAYSPTASSRPASDTYTIDPVHSSMIFRIKHMDTAPFYGRFNEMSGSINVDEANPSSSTLNVEVKIDSIDTNNKKRDSDVKAPSFFGAADFPTATFTSKSFKSTGDKTWDVTGDFTIHGVTKPLTIKLEKTGASNGRMGNAVGYEATFTFNRRDFGLGEKMPSGMLSDEVKMMAGIEAKK
jgi:polyisoprenoid-binding protein YceI